MVSKYMIVAAIPFELARLQSSLSRNIAKTTTEMSKCGNRVDSSNEPRRKRMRKLPLDEKIRLRRQRNIASAQVSRERAKVQKDIFEEKLYHLKYEKMKLLLENEALQKQNVELEEENESLKLIVQNQDNHSQSEETINMEIAIKYASFVSVPLLKEWALSKVVFILMMSMLESLKTNFLVPSYWSILSIQQSFSYCTRFLFNLACLPWKSIIHTNSPQYWMIFNG